MIEELVSFYREKLDLEKELSSFKSKIYYWFACTLGLISIFVFFYIYIELLNSILNEGVEIFPNSVVYVPIAMILGFVFLFSARVFFRKHNALRNLMWGDRLELYISDENFHRIKLEFEIKNMKVFLLKHGIDENKGCIEIANNLHSRINTRSIMNRPRIYVFKFLLIVAITALLTKGIEQVIYYFREMNIIFKGVSFLSMTIVLLIILSLIIYISLYNVEGLLNDFYQTIHKRKMLNQNYEEVKLIEILENIVFENS